MSLVTATWPPSMAIAIGAEQLPLEPSHPLNPRIDLVCLQLGYGHVITGTPHPSPVVPPTPAGLLLVAYVRVPESSTTIWPSNITEVRP